jgi:hypothetical protein
MQEISIAGGDMMIIGPQKRVTTIYFTFLDKRVA